MCGIFTYIYHKFKPNVGKYSIHGAQGMWVRKESDYFDLMTIGIFRSQDFMKNVKTEEEWSPLQFGDFVMTVMLVWSME